jgi:hypothetical protein
MVKIVEEEGLVAAKITRNALNLVKKFSKIGDPGK